MCAWLMFGLDEDGVVQITTFSRVIADLTTAKAMAFIALDEADGR